MAISAGYLPIYVGAVLHQQVGQLRISAYIITTGGSSRPENTMEMRGSKA
jgi:hypothetical protein